MKLPENVIARWDAADWNDESMTASAYRYEAADTREPVELTKSEASRYAWGQCQDDLNGGSQTGELREVPPTEDEIRAYIESHDDEGTHDQAVMADMFSAVMRREPNEDELSVLWSHVCNLVSHA